MQKLNFDLFLFCPKCQRRKPIDEKLTSVCCSNLVKTLITFNDYQNLPIAQLIIDGKFNNYWRIFLWWGELISEKLKILNLKNFSLTYVPLSKKIEKLRGFNQSEVLAKKIARNLNLPIFKGIKKIKETEYQAKLDYHQRLINIKDCFAVNQPPPQNLIIVDDIITTGSTIFELAKVLKDKGCKNIIALTICK